MGLADGMAWEQQYGIDEKINNPVVSDISFIFSKMKEFIDKQECDVVEYMNEDMNQNERYNHGENIWRFLLKSDALVAMIKIEMLANGRSIE